MRAQIVERRRQEHVRNGEAAHEDLPQAPGAMTPKSSRRRAMPIAARLSAERLAHAGVRQASTAHDADRV